MALLEVRDVTKSFRIGGETLQVLEGVDFDLAEGEILAIVGQSGSGKSTLLHQVGLLDKPDRGRVVYKGVEMPLTGAHAAYARNRTFGFIFQFYHLLPEFTALENVLMPAMILRSWFSYRRERRDLRDAVGSLLERVGLGARVNHRPPQLSGGERQRVASGRAGG